MRQAGVLVPLFSIRANSQWGVGEIVLPVPGEGEPLAVAGPLRQHVAAGVDDGGAVGLAGGQQEDAGLAFGPRVAAGVDPDQHRVGGIARRADRR